jgi:hypothetical protein
MIGFIFIGIPVFCIIVIIAMACSGWSERSRYKGHYIFIQDEDGEIIDEYLDRTSNSYASSTNGDCDYAGGILTDDGSVLITDDDDFLDEFGEDVL